MNTGALIIEKLQAYLKEHRAQGLLNASEGYHYEDEVDGMEVRLNVADFDRFSFVVRSLELRSLAAALKPENGIPALQKRADFISDRITYLVEDLAVVEKDKVRRQIQLRSATPDADAQAINYFELILDATGHLILRRYRYDRQERRRSPVTFSVTGDVLERLINDLVATYR